MYHVANEIISIKLISIVASSKILSIRRARVVSTTNNHTLLAFLIANWLNWQIRKMSVKNFGYFSSNFTFTSVRPNLHIPTLCKI